MEIIRERDPIANIGGDCLDLPRRHWTASRRPRIGRAVAEATSRALSGRRREQGWQTEHRGSARLPRQLTGKSPPANTPADANGAGSTAQKAIRAAKKAQRAVSPEIKPDHADLSYGPHANNKLDLWLAKSDRPTPLVVFIHGGGFVGGDKSSASAAAIKQCLDADVSFASINYRFRTEVPINTVLRDSARAIQFLRYKSDEFHFDKTRVAAFGGSAGAGTSLWLAFHDDLADPQSRRPGAPRIDAAGGRRLDGGPGILRHSSLARRAGQRRSDAVLSASDLAGVLWPYDAGRSAVAHAARNCVPTSICSA